MTVAANQIRVLDERSELLYQTGVRFLRPDLVSGGDVDTERMAKILLDEFRGGKLGRFTLETVEEVKA